MRLYFYGLIMLFRKFILRQNTGRVICSFAAKMGVVYIKVAQILAMQNYGSIFTEDDRQKLSVICDHCNPIPFRKIRKRLEKSYDCELSEIFLEIDETPLGSASISQVHRAILKDGREVAVKVKRRDVTRRIAHDTRQIRHLIHLLGHFAGFHNRLGSDRAIELWVNWIYQETDFRREARNLKRYQEFAVDVNNQVPDSIKLKTPQVYPEYCTDDVLVMEFIRSQTVNQLDLDPKNKSLIRKSLNDYLRLSFYALLNGHPVVFHGDPHGGNIYIDAEGNLGFLDMGLIFEFVAEEADYVRRLFLYAYLGRVEDLVDLILSNSNCATFNKVSLTADIREQVEKFHEIPVTEYFVDMVNVFTKYNVSPPEATFKMAKAFMALSGINNFSENAVGTQNLLANQVAEYYIQRTVSDFREIVHTGTRILPHFLQVSLRQGLTYGISSEYQELLSLREQVNQTLAHCREIWDYLCP